MPEINASIASSAPRQRRRSNCEVVELRPANQSPLEKAIYSARDAWFLADRARDRAATSEAATRSFLAQRDEHRRECGQQLARAKRLHAEAGINIPWKEWAPAQTGWSYMTVARRMKDFAEPDAPKDRREGYSKQNAKRKGLVIDEVTVTAKTVTPAEPVMQPEAAAPEAWENALITIQSLPPEQFDKFKAAFLSYIGGSNASS